MLDGSFADGAVDQAKVSASASAPAVGIFIGLLFVLLTVVWLRLTHKGSYVAPAVRRLPIVGNRLERVITGRTQTR